VRAEAAAARVADAVARRRALVRLRRELRRIAGRDFFPSPQRDAARAAVEDLAAAASQAGVRA
jgi:cobalamin biosynthesis protein CobD/CbiB